MTELPRKFRIVITKEDIAKGERENPYSCAVALAIKRRFPGYRVDVDGRDVERWRVEIRMGRKSRFYAASERMEVFIERFDRGQPVKPSTFVVTLAT